MEQARILAAIALSFLVFLVWEFFIVDKKQENGVTQNRVISQEKMNTTTPEQNPDVSPRPENIMADSLNAAREPSRTFVVDTPLYQAQISEQGAVVTHFRLKDFRETKDPDSPLLDMVDQKRIYGTLQLGFDKGMVEDMSARRFVSNQTSDHVEVNNKPQKLSFITVSANGLTVEKSFVFSPDTYLIDLNISIVNNSENSFRDSLVLTLSKNITEDKGAYGFVGPSALVDHKLEQIKIKKIKGESVLSGDISWIAFQDRYFISSILMRQPQKGLFRMVMSDPQRLADQYVQPETGFSPGSKNDFSYQVYFGPKDPAILKSFGLGLEKAVHFGFFDPIAKPFVWLMTQIYRVIPNYGVAIILLTVLIKILLWPLGTKSYKAMNEMKKIQPLMSEIKERFKDDKKKMNEEMMGLYRTYKVNPMGGCLPMLVQIPVFFALYRMLYEAIQLRHAPFFGWINDLSAPDRLFRFAFSVPFMQPPYGIPVLTLVMGATMFLQQKMSPPMGDPAQAKIMMFMPLFFTVIFINFSSGLVLYWLVNNVLSIAQQYYIQKKYA